jgi:hypothetical protein
MWQIDIGWGRWPQSDLGTYRHGLAVVVAYYCIGFVDVKHAVASRLVWQHEVT